jgi:hypothetical protein
MEAKSAFEFIKSNTKSDAGILFAKPRALTYFTQRKTYVNTEMATLTEIDKEVKSFNPDYILIGYEVTDDSTKTYFNIHQQNYLTAYENPKFKLLKKL